MSHPLRELSALIAPTRQQLGIVTAINGTRITIATAQGAVDATSASALKVGARVVVQNNRAEPAPVPSQAFAV